jgi:hypothetical protein
MIRSELRPARITIGRPELSGELGEHFRRSGFAVEVDGPTALRVVLPDAPDEEQARREIRAQLLVWSILHPDDPAELGD